MVPKVGIEPTHDKSYKILSLARLPVPPLRHVTRLFYCNSLDNATR